MKKVLLVISLLALGACSVEPGSEAWCEAKKEQSKSEWSGSDAVTFAKNCLIESQTIGSQKWCEDLADKPKGDWTGSEATEYAKHCLM